MNLLGSQAKAANNIMKKKSQREHFRDILKPTSALQLLLHLYVTGAGMERWTKLSASTETIVYRNNVWFLKRSSHESEPHPFQINSARKIVLLNHKKMLLGF